ncbi:uncharacterized protein [Clytia hemisphaerica]|uniref:BRICHOS domain-containing protein n=1 Tax=Clytia hemisphaerica TaxID=252671 RepID=A0A7M5XDU1_9CNID
MKFIILIAAIALATAKHSTDLNFNEGGKDYKEHIIFDEVDNTTEIHIPKHGNIPFAARYLIDHNLHYEVRILEGKSVCYLRKMEMEEEHSNRDLEAGIRNAGNTFPRDRYFVQRRGLFPISEMDKSELSSAIIRFCGSFPVILEKEATIDEVEKYLKNDLKTREKRGTGTVERWTPCKKGTYNGCKSAAPKCRFTLTSCIFWIWCERKGVILHCTDPKVSNHVYNANVCCDFVCQK